MATCRFNVHVLPKARTKQMSVIDGQTLRVRVTEVAEGGQGPLARRSRRPWQAR
jgi:uncharacterized protein YggU (UPF0235/DUF167 family)